MVSGFSVPFFATKATQGTQVSAGKFRDCEFRNLGIEGILPVESLRVERSF
jgi:hypothetical protein